MNRNQPAEVVYVLLFVNLKNKAKRLQEDEDFSILRHFLLSESLSYVTRGAR